MQQNNQSNSHNQNMQNHFNQNGVINGVFYCNIKEDNILNERISKRNMPSQPLQPQYSMRPASTKYSIMPIVDPRVTNHTVQMQSYPTYNVGETFNPGNAQAPWSGFATNIDTFSELRNQGVALQHCNQREYVPSSNSDLYESVIPVSQSIQTHPLLFKEEQFAPVNENPYNMGQKVFANHTRQDVKNITNFCHKN